MLFLELDVYTLPVVWRDSGGSAGGTRLGSFCVFVEKKKERHSLWPCGLSHVVMVTPCQAIGLVAIGFSLGTRHRV